MYSRVTGPQKRQQQEVKIEQLNFQDRFMGILSRLKTVKNEYRDIKSHRIHMKAMKQRQQKQKQAYKFSKVQKQQPYCPRVHFGEYFQKKDLVEQHDNYRDDRQTKKLIIPDKALSIPRDGRKWKLNTSTLNHIGQLKLDLTPDQKYLPSIKSGSSTNRYSTQNKSVKWSPVTTSLDFFEKTRPMVEQTQTPRSITKKIAIQRSLALGSAPSDFRTLQSTVTSSLQSGSILRRSTQQQQSYRKKKPWNPGNPFMREFDSTGFYSKKKIFEGTGRRGKSRSPSS